MLFKGKNFSYEIKKFSPLIMGILNITPDSFSDGGKFFSVDAALRRAEEMVKNGVDIIDIGAESSRPGADAVSPEDEKERLMPVLTAVLKEFNIPVSVDTTKSEVAEDALKAGASIINDISGLKRDPDMAKTVASYGAGVVIMHMRGDSKNMAELTSYSDLIRDIITELKESISIAAEAGIPSSSLVIDPGIGFAKNTAQSIEIVKNINVFHELGYPLLVGPSKKSFIGDILKKPVEERLFGTLAVIAYLAMKNVHIVRVHDVAEVSDFLRVYKKFISEG